MSYLDSLLRWSTPSSGGTDLSIGRIDYLVNCEAVFTSLTMNPGSLRYVCRNLMIYKFGSLIYLGVECSRIASAERIDIVVPDDSYRPRMVLSDDLISPVKRMFDKITDLKSLDTKYFCSNAHTWHDVFPTLFDENEVVMMKSSVIS